MSPWYDTVFGLIARAATDLPADVEAALSCAAQAEAPGSNAALTLQAMLDNIRLARANRRPLCQDTGALLFWVEAPPGVSPTAFRQAAEAAIADATAEGLLRQNCVDTLSGRNTGNNLGAGSPTIHWDERPGETVTLSLILKGGGSENVGAQYSLPDARLGAGRNLDGVRRCVLDAVVEAQGRGCSPGILGVCIGGDRASGYAEGKRLLLRPLGLRSPQSELAALETRLLDEASQLGIGPMGVGGNTTLLDVHVGCLHRLPASYFVSISYMCWACRRHALEAAPDGRLLRWR